jgi:uncharacterized repeat protein (TIGR03809 family)
MSERQPAHALEEVAQKWRVLAERRCAYFFELHRSGRWRRYYGEAQFLLRMREAIRLSERWAEIAPPPAANIAPEHSRRIGEMASRTAA